jgi:excisionase family DNA binding protein
MAAPDVPHFLTVEEAAEVLRFGRTKTYEQTNLWITTEGRDGIPARKVGGQIRVPTALLEEHFGIRITARPVPKKTKRRADGSEPVRQLDAARGEPRKRRRPHGSGPSQGGLPFAG